MKIQKKKMKGDIKLDAFENTKKPIYPKAGEDLLDFLLMQRDADTNVAICPRCSAVFNKNATRTFEEQRKGETKKEKEKLNKRGRKSRESWLKEKLK